MIDFTDYQTRISTWRRHKKDEVENLGRDTLEIHMNKHGGGNFEDSSVDNRM